MRHRQAVAIGEAVYASGQQAEARDVALLGGFEQQLHADTDAEQGLTQAADCVDQARAAQTLHAVGGSTDAGQDDVCGRTQRLRVRRDLRVDAEPLDRVP